MLSLDELRTLTPIEFEETVGALFCSMGWSVFWTPASGDHGVDLVLVKQKKRAVVQCKKYKGLVGEPEVREFYGSFAGKFKMGYYVTTADFTDSARDWVGRRKAIHLLPGTELVRLMDEVRPELVDKKPQWKEDL